MWKVKDCVNVCGIVFAVTLAVFGLAWCQGAGEQSVSCVGLSAVGAIGMITSGVLFGKRERDK